MRIGFDAKRYFHNNTGLGNYSRTLVQSLAKTFPSETFVLFSAESNIQNFESDNVKNVFVNKSFKSVWRSFGIAKNLRQENLDIFHGLSNELPFSLKNIKIKKVVTIHDLIFKHFPNQYPIIDRKMYDIKSKYACQNADIIIAASESTKKDIENFYHIEPDKIVVVYQSCDPQFKVKLQKEEKEEILKKYQIQKEFILYVGSFNERKNVRSIIEAYKILPPNSRISCVCIGHKTAESEALKKLVIKYQLESSFIFLHQIPSNELPAFYQSALCFLYPSLYEGFGIPILEAMNSQCPVITSNSSSLPEICGNAALYIDPLNVDEIAEAIQQIIFSTHIRNTIIDYGKLQSEFFSMKNPTIEMMQIYKDLME